MCQDFDLCHQCALPNRHQNSRNQAVIKHGNNEYHVFAMIYFPGHKKTRCDVCQARLMKILLFWTLCLNKTINLKMDILATKDALVGNP